MINEDDVAEYLLQKKFYLTALEFHQELTETNGATPPSLRNVFATLPGKESLDDFDTFFSQAVAQSNSSFSPQVETTEDLESEGNTQHLKEQMKNLQKELQQKQEQIQMLEYNLRKSSETVDSLRTQMTAITSNHVGGATEEGKEAEKLARELETVEDMKVHEKRTLNFLIKNFLLRAGYKLTAITFSDEVNDQDLDVWSSVGLNCSAPPSLLSFYRYFYNAGPNQYLSKIEEEANTYKKKAAKWKKRGKRIPELEAQIHELKMTIKFENERKNDISTKNNTKMETENVQEDSDKAKGGPEESVTESIAAALHSKKRKFRFEPMQLPEIRKIAWVEENSSVVQQIKQVSVIGKQEEGAVLVLGESLPIVTRSVILKARKDLLPLLLIAIQQHPDAKVRDPLTNLLFNLIKKPDEQQRQMIIIGCVALARLIGKERTEGELLPQCWEQISSKYEERRVLVAESCGALAAYTKSSMRVSLIMSMLMQLLDDKSALVREAVVKNVAQLISYFEDQEKYSKVEETLLKLFYDPDRDVVESVKKILVPVFMEWSQMLGLLLTRFMPLFTDEMGKLLKNMDPGRINETDVSRVEALFDVLLLALPHMASSILSHSPVDPGPPASKQILTAPTAGMQENKQEEETFGNTFGIQDSGIVLDDKQKEHLLSEFENFLASKMEGSNFTGETWDEWTWFTQYVTNLIQIICRSQALESPRIANGVSVIVSKICALFGETFTKSIMRSKFQQVLEKERNFFKSAKELENARKRAMPVYLLGVLTSLKDSELIQVLKETILNIAESVDAWNMEHFSMIKDSIRLLCTSANKTDQVVTLLTRDLVSNPSDDVRITVVRLYEDIMLFLSATDLESKLFPALITLSSDVSPNVRLATIKQLCNVAKIVTQKPLIEKIDMQFDFLLTDNGHDMLMEILREFTQLIPASNSNFRELCILPKLIKIVDLNNHTVNEQQRSAGFKQIIDAYRAFNGCVISEQTIQMFILPGLRLLHANSKAVDPTLMAKASRMISDMERALNITPTVNPAKDEKKRWGRK